MRFPGGKRPEQVADNAKASDLAPLSDEVHSKVLHIYEERIKPWVHQRW